MPRVTYQVNVEDPCVWDYLFIAWHDTSKKLDDWKDVESAIKEWVIGKGSISLNDALNYWTILSVKPSRPDAVVNAYLKIQKYVNEHSSNIDFSVLNYFNTSADLDDEGSEDPVEILRVKLLDFFAKELHVIEDAFTRYLIRVQGNPSYDSSSRNIYKAMARIQLVSATAGFGSACFDCSLAISSSHTSLGVLYPRSFMGVSLISPTIASSSSCVRSSKLVPLGR